MILFDSRKSQRYSACYSTKNEAGRLVREHKTDPRPSTFQERMKIMSNLNSARLREETPHISDALKRRAQSIINNKSIDAQTRAVIRYGLETNDPWLGDLVRCVDAGESIIDNLYVHSSEEKIEALTNLICRAGDEPSAALLVLLSTLENSTAPKSTREHGEAPCLHSLRRVEPLRHGRRADCSTCRKASILRPKATNNDKTDCNSCLWRHSWPIAYF